MPWTTTNQLLLETVSLSVINDFKTNQIKKAVLYKPEPIQITYFQGHGSTCSAKFCKI
jgi:hypothetical protein